MDLPDSMYKNAIIQNLLNLNWFGLGTFHRASFFTGQTSLPLVTIALILTAICGPHLTLWYYHLTWISRSCVQSMNGIQVSGWRYPFNETHTCLTIKSFSKTFTMEGVVGHTAAWPHIWTTTEPPLQCQVCMFWLSILYTFLIFVIELLPAKEYLHRMRRVATMMKWHSWQFSPPISPLSHK